jgi:serine/threonine protein kinase
VGEVYAERYRVEALLGRGGMGQVYRVRDLRDDSPCALKLLLPEAEARPDRVERFKREIGVLSRIRHPAVLRIFAWGNRGDALFFVSELVDGPDLKTEIQRRGPWAMADALALSATVADALAAAHAAGVVHRDVKPNNIMIASDGSARLLDFGLARGVGIDMASLTRTGMVMGTPAYMSPEQFEGVDVDERSDLYSLGVVMFEMLTGRLVFTGRTPMAVALLHRSEPPPLLRALRPDLPAWLERAILRCLEKDPSRRFAAASELAAELRRPRSGGVGRPRRLPSGDFVVEDQGEVTDWALVLLTLHEKTGWSPGLALHYEERYFRLGAIDPPRDKGGSWTYRFSPWPEAEIFRRIVDYEQDCVERAAAVEQGRLGSRLSRWMSGRKE